MPPKKPESTVPAASPEVKVAPIHPLIIAAQAQRDKWQVRVNETRGRVDECVAQLERSRKAAIDAESRILALLQQATDIVYPKEIKEAPVLPVITAQTGKDKGKTVKNASPIVQAAVQEPVAPPPPVLTEAQLKKKAKLQMALLNAYKKKKYVPQADDVVAPPPLPAADSNNDAGTPRSVAAGEGVLGRPSRPNDKDLKDELWDALMKLRDSRIETEDKIVALKNQMDMLQQRLTALSEMERVTKYALIGAENDIVTVTQRVEDMAKAVKEQQKLEMEARLAAAAVPAAPVGGGGPVQLGPIKNAPMAPGGPAGLSPRVRK
jgi:hypothetical protein